MSRGKRKIHSILLLSGFWLILPQGREKTGNARILSPVVKPLNNKIKSKKIMETFIFSREWQNRVLNLMNRLGMI